MAWLFKNVKMNIWVAKKYLYFCVCVWTQITLHVFKWQPEDCEPGYDFINGGYSEICSFPCVWIIKAWSRFIKKRCGLEITCQRVGPCCSGVRKLLFPWQKSTDWGLRNEPAIRVVKWDVGSPRSVRPVSPTASECSTLSAPPSGGMMCGWPGWSGVVLPGRIHAAPSLKSLSRQLLSLHLGSLPRVAAPEMGEVVGTGEMMFHQQLTFYPSLTVLHCDVESSSTMGRLSHFLASVGLLC